MCVRFCVCASTNICILNKGIVTKVGRCMSYLTQKSRLMVSLGRFKSKETDFVGFNTKFHISRYVNPIFMFFMSETECCVVLE